jgi:hypothetical protein
MTSAADYAVNMIDRRPVSVVTGSCSLFALTARLCWLVTDRHANGRLCAPLERRFPDREFVCFVAAAVGCRTFVFLGASRLEAFNGS